MSTTLLGIAFLVLIPGEDPKAERKPHPFAPSLPLLTEEEEAKLDHIVNRFILYDVGRLPGLEGRKALQDFQRLGPEATPALLRGLNRAAHINHSCPALVIAKKLNTILRSSRDIKLLEFAREEIGAGVGKTRHHAVLQDLRVHCMLRKNALVRQGVAPLTSDGKKEPRYMSLSELSESAEKDNGLRLRRVMAELSNRKGEEAVDALGKAADRGLSDITTFARTLLLRNMTKKQDATLIRKKLSAESSELRQAAIRAAFARKLKVEEKLVELLGDKDYKVAELAHRALVRISNTDYGPSQAATEEERKEAISKWQQWLRTR